MWVFPDRSKSLLSGEEIINFKQNSLKDVPAGSKDYAPDNSWLESKQIQATLETHHTLVGAQRIEKKSSLSSAEWLADVGKAKVTKKTGRHWEVFGHTSNSEDWLLPEEVLFLLETNALQLYLDDVPLSVEQTYELIIGEYVSLEEYRVYSHLSRKGYRVLRHDKDISVTPYEKDIHADQPSLAPKRSVPGTKEKNTKPSLKNDCQALESAYKGTRQIPDSESSVALLSSKDNESSQVSTKSSAEESTSARDPLRESADKGPRQIPDSESSVASLSKDNGSPQVATKSPAEESTSAKDPLRSNTKNNGKGDEASGQEPPETMDAESNIGLPVANDKPVSELPTRNPQSTSDDGNSFEVCDKSANQDQAEVIDSDTNSTPSDVPNLISKSKNLISQVQSLVAKNGQSTSGGGADHLKKSFNVDDSSSEDEFPRLATSPDIMIVETDKVEVIEINDDSPSEGEDDIVIMEEQKPNMDTVDLLDSDEDDEVVIIQRKPAISDPSKWRKWFASEPEFLINKSKATSETSSTISKVKMIDLFDLGNKSSESIWKAVPNHDGSDEFINSPDQRFIPSTILPKYAQYRVNLHQRNQTPSVDTTGSLNEVVSYGQEPSDFSRNDGYCFHRSRNFNQNQWQPWDSNRPPQNQGRLQNGSYRGSGFNFGRTDDRRNGGHGSNNRGYGNRFGNDGFSQNRNRNFGNQPNAQQTFPPSQNSGFGSHHNTNFGNISNQLRNVPDQFGGVQNDGLKMAVVQACQMQLLAMGLMQSCQAIMQQVPGFVNPMNNNIFPALMGNNFGQPQPYRGHRPYRRPWRGNQGRRRYYNEDRNSFPRVTEIPSSSSLDRNETSDVIVIENDDEDKKVKPAIKRSMALNAIASLNKPKRSRLKITTEVKSIKLDSPGPSKVNIVEVDEASSVKSESPQPKSTLASRAEDVVEARSRSMSMSSADSSGKNCPTVEEVRASPLGFSEDQRSLVIDDRISVDSDSVGFISEKSFDAPASGRAEPMDTSRSVDIVEEIADSSSQPVEAMDTVPCESLERTAAEQLPATEQSWKTYKEQEPSSRIKSQKEGHLLAIDNERADIKDVMRSLQVIGPIDVAETPRGELKVTYDVYLPNQPFRKSLKLLPNYRVIIVKSEVFPTIFELNHLDSTYPDKVPLLFAVVTYDAIRFYHLRSVSLPTLIPDV